jgi:hypothetical protein
MYLFIIESLQKNKYSYRDAIPPPSHPIAFTPLFLFNLQS